MTRVALFVPCLVDQSEPMTAQATLHLLRETGYEIVWVKEQTCCGQALFNAGFRRHARDLATRFIRLFSPYDFIVAPSGSCVAMVKHHYRDLGLSNELLTQWISMRERVFELCQFLLYMVPYFTPEASFPYRVLYHPSCHYTRELGEKRAPLALLERVKGIQILKEADEAECCGFGGAFSLKYPGLSRKIAQRRWQAIRETAPDVVTGVDDSCLGHLRGSTHHQDTLIPTLHISLILAGLAGELGGTKGYGTL